MSAKGKNTSPAKATARMESNSPSAKNEGHRENMLETPRSLGNEQHRLDRKARLQELHITDLTAFVETIRTETNRGDNVPYFDPEDGGIYAECLFLLEAPGRNAISSGFVSRDNPDCTAENWFRANKLANIDRKKTLMWNIVPWYIGQNGKILPAKKADIDAGSEWLLDLLTLLHRQSPCSLRVVVLVGRKAQKVEQRLLDARKDLHVMRCPHPSPSFINRDVENNWNYLVSELEDVSCGLTEVK